MGQRREARNADGVLNLLPSEMQRATSDLGEASAVSVGVMPSVLATAREGRFAETHLELVQNSR